jgi:hypothetical protein
VYDDGRKNCRCQNGYQLINGGCLSVVSIINSKTETEILSNQNLTNSQSIENSSLAFQSHHSGVTILTPSSSSSILFSPQITIPQTPISSNSNSNALLNTQSCDNIPNTYWTGSRCECKVGYTSNGKLGYCVKIGFSGGDGGGGNINITMKYLPQSIGRNQPG